MFATNLESITQVVGGVSLAAVAIFVGIQKLLKDWKSTNAETSIITLMHSELERMSHQNTALSLELGRLHADIIVLSNKLQDLTIENQRLQSEVIALTNEISKLTSLTRKEY